MEFKLEHARQFGLAMALAGFLALLFLTPEYRNANAYELTAGDIGKKISMTGKATGFFMKGGHAFFKIEGNGLLDAVAFNATPEQVSALRARMIVVKGTVASYGNKLEIIADKISPAG